MSKNILILSVEFEIGLSIFLARELKKLNFNPVILVADSWSLIFSRENLQKIIKINSDINIVSIENILKEINSTSESITYKDIDWEYLDILNNKIKEFYTINDLLRCDVGLLDDHHDFGYFNYKPNKFLLTKYIEISSKFIEKLFENNSINYVFSYNTQGLFKPLTYAISQSLKIKYITMIEARIDNLNIISDNFGLGFSTEITQNINRLLKLKSDCTSARNYISNYCKSDLPPYYSHSNLIEKLLNTKLKLKSSFLKYLVWSIYRGKYIYKNCYKYRKKNYFNPTYFSNILYYFKTYSRINSYILNPNLNMYFSEEQLKNINYVYFPLHRMPENSASTTSKILYEDSVIFDLSRKIPPSWSILVKIPPGMFMMDGDSREVSWYQRIEKIPNVIFVSPFIDSKMLIKNCKFVASISGTALLEAHYFNKYGICWGNPEFSNLNCIKRMSDIDQIISNVTPTNNNIAFYVESIFETGIRFNRTKIEDFYKNIFSSEKYVDYDNSIKLISNKICELI